MADFPVVNFAQYQWEVNDKNYLTKWNNFQTAITTLQNSLDTFGGEVEQELASAIETVEAIRDDEVIPAKNTAVQAATTAGEYRNETQQLRDEAEQIVTGDTPITNLKPGTLTAPKDYVSTDGAGSLVVRNVDTDVAARLADGVETITFDAVEKGTVSTGTVSFDVLAATKQKLTVGGALTIALTNKPTNDWELEVDLTNGGSAAITFPTVNWLIGDGTTSTVFADMGVTLNAAGANTLLFWGTGTGDVYGRAG